MARRTRVYIAFDADTDMKWYRMLQARDENESALAARQRHGADVQRSAAGGGGCVTRSAPVHEDRYTRYSRGFPAMACPMAKVAVAPWIRRMRRDTSVTRTAHCHYTSPRHYQACIGTFP